MVLTVDEDREIGWRNITSAWLSFEKLTDLFRFNGFGRKLLLLGGRGILLLLLGVVYLLSISISCR